MENTSKLALKEYTEFEEIYKWIRVSQMDELYEDSNSGNIKS